MRIVPVTIADLAEYKALPVELEYDDYVADLFPGLVAEGGFYKAVDDDGALMAVARTYPVAGRYAYLGSARTGVPYRGRGIATAMARFLIDDVRRRGFTWAGLSTADDNVAVHKSMDRLGLQLLGTKAFIVVKAGGLPQFLAGNGIAVSSQAAGHEVTDREEKIQLLREMLASARGPESADRHVSILSCEPFVILPPNDDLAALVVDQYRVRRVDGLTYALKTGVSEGWNWAECSFYGGDVLSHPDVLADIHSQAPADMELWLLLPPAALARVNRETTEWSGVLRLYGLEL